MYILFRDKKSSYGRLDYKQRLERRNNTDASAMYVVDMKKEAKKEKLINIDETGEVMQLATVGQKDEATGICGIEFPYGSTGMISLGDGYFYFSRNFRVDNFWGTDIGLYEFQENKT